MRTHGQNAIDSKYHLTAICLHVLSSIISSFTKENPIQIIPKHLLILKNNFLTESSMICVYITETQLF